MKKVVNKNVDGNDELFETILELLLNDLDTEDSDTSDDEDCEEDDELEDNDEDLEPNDDESHCPLEEVINCITKDIDKLQNKVANIEKALEENKHSDNINNKAIGNLAKKVDTLYDIMIKHFEDKYTPKGTIVNNG